MRNIAVDSVEKFQGSERRVIIVSTVRSKGIGFLDCEKVSSLLASRHYLYIKRFNTTITRAQELLIVVGDHLNLRQIPSWREWVSNSSDR